MSIRRCAISSLALALSLGCGSSAETVRPGVIVLPGPPSAAPLPAPKTPPEDLPGVDTSKLTVREKGQWWNLVSQLYAPCSDQAVSIVQCLKEQRACNACAQAARMIAGKVQSGASRRDVEAAYGVRFGPNVYAVEVADSPAIGPEDASITVMVWTDFECPHCRMTMPIVEGLVEEYSPHVRLVHKFYPLKHHVNSGPATRAAIAAQRQGRFWEMERMLFDNQGNLEPNGLEGFARKLYLDLPRFKADMESSRTAEAIERDTADADRAGLMGTPFILINGREFNFAYFQPEADMGAWIEMELEILGVAR